MEKMIKKIIIAILFMGLFSKCCLDEDCKLNECGYTGKVSSPSVNYICSYGFIKDIGNCDKQVYFDNGIEYKVRPCLSFYTSGTLSKRIIDVENTPVSIENGLIVFGSNDRTLSTISGLSNPNLEYGFINISNPPVGWQTSSEELAISYREYAKYSGMIGDNNWVEPDNPKCATCKESMNVIIDTLDYVHIYANRDYNQQYRAGKLLDSIFTIGYGNPVSFIQQGYKGETDFRENLAEFNKKDKNFYLSNFGFRPTISPSKQDTFVFHFHFRFTNGKKFEFTIPRIIYKEK